VPPGHGSPAGVSRSSPNLASAITVAARLPGVSTVAGR